MEKSVSEEYFINRSPVEIISSGNASKVPWFTGVVSEEGLYPAAGKPLKYKIYIFNFKYYVSKLKSISEFIDEKNLKHLNDNWDLVATYVLDYNYTLPKDKHKEIAKKIRKHYFGKKAIDKSTISSVVQMVGDRLFVSDGERAARLMAKSNKNQVKFYYYSYRAAQSLSESLSGTKENYGMFASDWTYKSFKILLYRDLLKNK